MSRYQQRPPLEGLRREIARARKEKSEGRNSGSFVRETYRLSRGQAREKAREWFSTWPKAAYWTEVESWRALPGEGDEIEFTMRRLPTAD